MKEPLIGLQQVTNKSGSLTWFQPPKWYWTRNGGDYTHSRDFFCVHWEIQQAPLQLQLGHFVRLHVECPRFGVDSLLNGIKEDLVMDLALPALKQAVLRAGFEYKISGKRSQQYIRQFPCTEVFRVLLPQTQWLESPEANLSLVDGRLHANVEEVVARLRPALDREFSG